MTEHALPIEINTSDELCTVAFSANGEYIISAGQDYVEVWRVQDGKREVKFIARDIHCLAVSKNGRWFAGGASMVLVWDAKTFKLVQRYTFGKAHLEVHAVDFSPDSTRLVSGSGSLDNLTAMIWDVESGEKVNALKHEARGPVIAAKYSQDGERIATATTGIVHVWDSADGHLLVSIPAEVALRYNKGLAWSNDHIVVISNDKIKRLDSSTCSTVSEYPVPDSYWYSKCMVLPEHGRFIAHSSKCSVTFWDMSTYSQLCFLDSELEAQKIYAIALSPDNMSFAIAREDGKITVMHLPLIVTDSSISPITGLS